MFSVIPGAAAKKQKKIKKQRFHQRILPNHIRRRLRRLTAKDNRALRERFIIDSISNKIFPANILFEILTALP
jgi:hypothetical protein